MRVKLVCLEDGIVSCGFRKIAAYVERLSLLATTEVCYVSTGNYRSVIGALKGTFGGPAEFDAEMVDEIARGLADADVVGFSSMTGYAELTRAIIRALRRLPTCPYLVWGGIHPIIHPEDAIRSEVDAICIGEGEQAFEEVLSALAADRDPSGVRNFWFRRDGQIVRNPLRPLQTPAELQALPYPKYGEKEWIYKQGRGFVPLRVADYLACNGLGYTAIWSIGCPLHCTYCGNTKFLANDSSYARIRHPGARYIIEEVKEARRKHPHLSVVSFHDDSFLAIPLRELTELAELWRKEVDLPFAVYGVIPSYVRRDKLEVLTWAGMNRVRMGIQSGSKRILDFYKRPTPPEKIAKAAEVLASFAPRYHIPPSYDVIMDNPIETREDVVDTLELLYRLARPYTVLVYSLKVIPNTDLERQLQDLGVDLEAIDANYSRVPSRWANVVLYLLAIWRPPRRVFDWLLKNVRASGEEQPSWPLLAFTMRSLYFGKRFLSHLRFMDFSLIAGRSGYVLWRLGVLSLWRELFERRPPRPEAGVPRPDGLRPGVAAGPPQSGPCPR